MSITLVDGLAPDPAGATVRRALERVGKVGATHALAGERFAPCTGCFECWTAHPGTCKAKDAANDLMRDIIAGSEVVWAVRPRHGCWDVRSKQALDKTIGLLSPFFRTVEGETHHRPRYPRYPRMGMVAIGCPPEDRELLRLLVARNALNLQTEDSWVAFVDAGASEEEVAAAVTSARAERTAGFPGVGPFATRENGEGVLPGAGPRRVLLLVGSAKPAGKSLSERLGRALLERLEARGWSTEVEQLSRLVKLEQAPSPRLTEIVRAADLVVLSTPVYFDCLPALVLQALAQLEDAGPGGSRPALLPIVQCGFPELAHDAIALEVLSRFCAPAGLRWAGHLALGGGGFLEGAHLDAPRGPGAHQVRALDLTAEALHAGDPVPPLAITEFATPPIGPGLYRFMGNVGWLAQAIQHGSLWGLSDRPFEAAPGP